jgi:hypothetical protein
MRRHCRFFGVVWAVEDGADDLARRLPLDVADEGERADDIELDEVAGDVVEVVRARRR